MTSGKAYRNMTLTVEAGLADRFEAAIANVAATNPRLRISRRSVLLDMIETYCIGRGTPPDPDLLLAIHNGKRSCPTCGTHFAAPGVTGS